MRRLLASVAVAVTLAAAGTTSLPSPPAHAASDLVQGFAMWSNQPPTEYSRIAETGANTIYLDVYWEADSPQSNSVHSAPPGTESDVALGQDIDNARNAGLRVVLMPKIHCEGCQYGWRGFLQPSDPHAFLRSYTDMVTHYAELGQQHGVWLLFLGSEMSTLQGYADDWRQMAAAVRQTGFHGLITYQPNWDVIGNVAFWDVLDVVTVSAYFPLTPTAEPSVGELKQAWHSSQASGYQGANWFGQVQRLATSTGKRVLIGEVGYRSGAGAANNPWDESVQETPDNVTQANAYQALLETFSPQPWWMGVIWWQWRGADPETPNSDISPKGKLAEQLLTNWWVYGWRPVPGSNASFATGAGPSRGAPAPGARTLGSIARQGPAGSVPSTAASVTTNPTAGDPAAGAAGVVNGDESSAAISGPRSLAHLDHASTSRAALIVIAVLALLGMSAASVTLGLRRVRLPGRDLAAS